LIDRLIDFTILAQDHQPQFFPRRLYQSAWLDWACGIGSPLLKRRCLSSLLSMPWHHVQYEHSIVYDSIVPFGYMAGYAIQVRMAGHDSCNCFRARPVQIFYPHQHAMGQWPVHFLREHFLLTLLPTTWQPIHVHTSVSYGSIHPAHLLAQLQ
jgi:hypothetical protein